MRTVVLAPWRPSDGERQKLWDFTLAWWAESFGDLEVFTGTGPDGPFNRSAAINEAAAAAGEWDVALIVDTDSIPEERNVAAAIHAAAATGQMVVAHTRRHMLTKAGTARVLGGYTGTWTGRPMADKVFHDSVSCCVAVNRDLWDRVGGFDEQFIGWGREDTAFRIACEAHSGHPIVCLDGESWHLWHAPSPDVRRSSELRQANERRHQLYVEARWDLDKVRALTAAPEGPPTVIPRILHRTVPADTSAEIEAWWDRFAELHPGWDLRTYREPVDPADWPLTGDLFARCENGAQKAGLIRLEALFTHGGVYVDSDVEPFRSFDELLQCQAFAAWEDETTVPDAVLGAAAGHPAWRDMIDRARAAVKGRKGAWASGPGITTAVLPGRPDVLILPPGAFYAAHYHQKAKLGDAPKPYEFARHHWHHSWGSDTDKARIAAAQVA